MGLEDAVLEIENEKADWAKRIDGVSRQLAEESAKRQHFEQQLYDGQVELASYRNTAIQAERELAKAASEIKSRDQEIALLRSRENKTIVEHVYVLENAKKIAERQTAVQIEENSRLNSVLKTLEATRMRLTAELEDAKRQIDLLKAGRHRAARAARASMTAEEKDPEMALEDERRARQAAEARVASLEKDLQDQRKQLSTANLSSHAPPSRNGSVSIEVKLTGMQQELIRLQQEHEAALAKNEKLEGQVTELQRSSRFAAPSTPVGSGSGSSHRADLLRGLQQSHDALGRDMSDQLRKLENTPLTPSRRQPSALANGLTGSPDLGAQSSKRVRTLEKEIDGLRQQLEDEREEKDFLYARVRELSGEGGEDGQRGPDGQPFPFEQAMYSHFRLKAKSLRSQLDQ